METLDVADAVAEIRRYWGSDHEYSNEELFANIQHQWEDAEGPINADKRFVLQVVACRLEEQLLLWLLQPHAADAAEDLQKLYDICVDITTEELRLLESMLDSLLTATVLRAVACDRNAEHRKRRMAEILDRIEGTLRKSKAWSILRTLEKCEMNTEDGGAWSKFLELPNVLDTRVFNSRSGRTFMDEAGQVITLQQAVLAVVQRPIDDVKLEDEEKSIANVLWNIASQIVELIETKTDSNDTTEDAMTTGVDSALVCVESVADLEKYLTAKKSIASPCTTVSSTIEINYDEDVELSAIEQLSSICLSLYLHVLRASPLLLDWNEVADDEATTLLERELQRFLLNVSSDQSRFDRESQNVLSFLLSLIEINSSTSSKRSAPIMTITKLLDRVVNPIRCCSGQNMEMQLNYLTLIQQLYQHLVTAKTVQDIDSAVLETSFNSAVAEMMIECGSVLFQALLSNIIPYLLEYESTTSPLEEKLSIPKWAADKLTEQPDIELRIPCRLVSTHVIMRYVAKCWCLSGAASIQLPTPTNVLLVESLSHVLATQDQAITSSQGSLSGTLFCVQWLCLLVSASFELHLEVLPTWHNVRTQLELSLLRSLHQLDQLKAISTLEALFSQYFVAAQLAYLPVGQFEQVFNFVASRTNN
ncbi:Hypothetical protein PHPALM_5122 [Phytophthora palmivora]|uniref:Uncharacterized protein n=1 Tax=Phytophthora palmivora TaxID=4796 RepID=A0A2P4YI56_9STRA|nr:Hypothetical protein PHPALM_5122 [Phytophthora palmivora]